MQQKLQQKNKQTNKNPGKCNKYNFSRIMISSRDLWKYIHNISYDKSGNEKNCSWNWGNIKTPTIRKVTMSFSENVVREMVKSQYNTCK